MDGEFRKKRRRLPKNRLKEIPNFDLSDIMGDFDIDDQGNNLIVKTNDGKLNDREGKRVNRRGYLIDIEGNIATKRGVLIFRIDEVDSDDEIPAPSMMPPAIIPTGPPIAIMPIPTPVVTALVVPAIARPFFFCLVAF